VWRALLDGNLTDVEQAELTTHLDRCPTCRERLEALDGAGSWCVALARRVRTNRPALDATLRQAMAALSDEFTPGGDDQSKSPVAVELGFLDPPAQPGHLGRFAHYEVLEVVGRGGMGVVLKALDENLQRVVAIKVMAPQLATSASARQRFLREARAAASVRNEHVIGIHAVDEVKGLPYIVMEFIGGVSLQDKLDGAGSLGLAEVLRIGMQTAAGLAAAHAQGLVHRDVKPANILLENGVERVKLTDFGLARAVDDASLTQSGVVTGTPQYMSPEQAHGEPVDHRSDLFSLGSVLYTMAAGRPPFRAGSTLAVLKRIGDDEPRPVRDVNPAVPEWLDEAIRRLHVKDPGGRFQSADDVAALLGRGLAALQHSGEAPCVPQAARPQRRRSRRLVISALVAAVLAVGLLFSPTIYRFATNQGEVIIETDDPDVEVVVTKDSETAKIIDRKTGRTVTLQAGTYQVELGENSEGLKLLTSNFTLERGGKAIVRVRLGAPKISEARRFTGLTEMPYHAAFCLGGECVLSCGGGDCKDGQWLPGSDFALRLWDARTGRGLRRLEGHRGVVFCVAVSPDGKRALSGGGGEEKDHALRYWNLETGKLIRELKGHQGRVLSIVISPDGRRAYSAGGGNPEDKEWPIRVWDLETGQPLAPFVGHTWEVRCLTLSADGRLLLSGSQDETARLWEVESRRELRALEIKGPIHLCVALSPDGRQALTAGADSVARLWDTKAGTLVRTFRGHTGAWIGGIAFSPDGTRALTGGGEDKSIRLWDVESGNEICRFDGYDANSHVGGASMSADGRSALSWGWDKTIRLLRLPPRRDARTDK
jgi:serine/threonine protein kinase